MQEMIKYFQTLEARITACEMACGIIAPLDARVRQVYKTEGLISALKLYRNSTGASLVQARDHINSLCADLRSAPYQS